MKKIVVLIFTIALIFSFTACNGNRNDSSPVEEGYQIFDKYNQIGETYTKEMAEKADDVIMYHDGVHNIDRLKQFITDSENNIEQRVRISMYTIEGDPIIKFLYHKDGKTMLWIDNTRDQFAAKKNQFVTEHIIERFQIDESDTERIYVAITDSGEEINLVREEKTQNFTEAK